MNNVHAKTHAHMHTPTLPPTLTHTKHTHTEHTPHLVVAVRLDSAPLSSAYCSACFDTQHTHIHTHSPTPTHPHTTTCSHLVGAVRLDSAPLSSAYCDTSSGLAIWNCTWKCARSHTHTHVVTVNCAEWLKESA